MEKKKPMAVFVVVLTLVVCSLDLIRAATVCCDGLGCYSDDPPFDGLPLPECPEVMQVSMRVYTRQNPTEPEGQVITRNTIPPAFQGDKLTIFVVHGWLGSKDNPWMQDIKDELLIQGDYNVIVVGWDGGAQQLWYPQSAADTRTVGGEMGLVASNIIANGGSATQRLHCVGHSLGGHVCGHAGQHTHFGRITGMDPAGPLFENRDWSCGLNPSCADRVDVIHSHGEPNIILNLGTMKALGHVDFYPNGGGQQPGCILDPLTSSAEARPDLTPACSHFRAVWYFTESINSDCFLSRYTCTDQYNLPGSCTQSPSPVQSMGFHSNTYSNQGIFYLTTNEAEPYCQG